MYRDPLNFSGTTFHVYGHRTHDYELLHLTVNLGTNILGLGEILGFRILGFMEI